jgi:hypothetical protein
MTLGLFETGILQLIALGMMVLSRGQSLKLAALSAS